MRFKEWLQTEAGRMGLQAPTAMQYAKTAAAGIGKAAVGAIPFMGTVMDVASTARRLIQMRQQGQDITPLILKMMHQQDQGGAPANAFDLDDNLAAMMSDPSKMEVARRIIKNIDTLMSQGEAQARAEAIPPNMANREAIAYIQTIMSQVGR